MMLKVFEDDVSLTGSKLSSIFIQTINPFCCQILKLNNYIFWKWHFAIIEILIIISLAIQLNHSLQLTCLFIWRLFIRFRNMQSSSNFLINVFSEILPFFKFKNLIKLWILNCFRFGIFFSVEFFMNKILSGDCRLRNTSITKIMLYYSDSSM